MFKLFETAVNAVSGKSINSRTTEKQQDDSWKETAREKADLIYQKQKTIGCDPSKKNIAGMIAKECQCRSKKVPNSAPIMYQLG